MLTKRTCLDVFSVRKSYKIRSGFQSSPIPVMRLLMLLPFTKKPSLDKNVLKSYRPVSNLSFIPKFTQPFVPQKVGGRVVDNTLVSQYHQYNEHCISVAINISYNICCHYSKKMYISHHQHKSITKKLAWVLHGVVGDTQVS